MKALLIGNGASALRAGLEVEGFCVNVAEGFYDAGEKIRADSFDLIILDLEFFPAGLLHLRQWRHSNVDAHVVVVAPGSTKSEVARALNCGADTALTKPYRFEELMARVRALMRRRHPPMDKILRVYDLEMNTSTRTVRRAGKIIRLTRREYALLQCLFCHQGHAVSPAVIWDHLNPEPAVTQSNVIAVYIRYLRIKIDEGFELPLILTVRGKGYLLRGEFAGGVRHPPAHASTKIVEPELEEVY